MRDYRYWPADIDEVEPKKSWISQPVPPENVGVLVPSQQRSLHAVIAQSLKDTEALIGRLELGVRVADSGRGLIRDLDVQCRRAARGPFCCTAVGAGIARTPCCGTSLLMGAAVLTDRLFVMGRMSQRRGGSIHVQNNS